MFGYLRLILAVMVALSHLQVRWFGLNQGVIAVVIFYILAGYVTTFLYQEVIQQKPSKILNFYKNRLLRIFPLYFIVLFFTTMFLLVTNYGYPHFSLPKLLYNITIIPLNYYMYLDSTILSKPNWCIIPPAWSLGTELQAYLFLPFAIISKRFRLFALLFTLSIYTIANFQLIHPDYYGYRFIVGVFFIFIIGNLIKQKEYKLLTYIYIYILLTIGYSILKGYFSLTYTKETYIGLLIGIPLTIYLSTFSKKLIFDRYFGALSYAIFLTHFLSIWILNYLDFHPDNKNIFNTSVIILSFTMSNIFLKIEKITIK